MGLGRLAWFSRPKTTVVRGYRLIDPGRDASFASSAIVDRTGSTPLPDDRRGHGAKFTITDGRNNCARHRRHQWHR
jgi:hypothetical protein